MRSRYYESSIRTYLKQAAKYKVLTREEESNLIAAYRNGDMNAYHQLIACNGRFIFSLALKYKSSGVPLADLLQEGHIGLIDALKRYNPESNCRLLTLAVWYIKVYIRRCVLNNFSVVRNGTLDLKTQLFAKNKSVQKRAQFKDASLDAPIGDTKEENETGKNYLDLLEAESNSDPESIYLNEESKVKLREVIQEALESLNEQEQEVLRSRLLGEEKQTMREIGEKMNVSRQYVQQIEDKASAKMKVLLQNKKALEIVA